MKVNVTETNTTTPREKQPDGPLLKEPNQVDLAWQHSVSEVLDRTLALGPTHTSTNNTPAARMSTIFGRSGKKTPGGGHP